VAGDQNPIAPEIIRALREAQILEPIRQDFQGRRGDEFGMGG
jgi:hypothetical protein